MLSCLSYAALWSPAGKGLASWLVCIWSYLVFCHFPMWCPGSDVVPDCMDSWSLPSHFLCYISSWWLIVNIFSNTLEGHFQRLDQDPTWQKESNLKLNHQNWKLLQTWVGYVGHILSEVGIEADPQIFKCSFGFSVDTMALKWWWWWQCKEKEKRGLSSQFVLWRSHNRVLVTVSCFCLWMKYIACALTVYEYLVSYSSFT